MVVNLFSNLSLLTESTAAKSLQSYPTLCNPIDSSPLGSAIPGILQARTQEWVIISFFNAWKWKGKVKPLSHVWFLATLRTAAYQVPPSMGFSRQEYWGGCHCLLVELPYEPAIPLLGIHTEETIIEIDTCTSVFITALFITARTWKQPRCPSADG